jgi:phosphopantetheinyl transferase (holo-ACP synthase)
MAVADVERVGGALHRRPRLVRAVFSDDEIRECRASPRAASEFAMRLSAKEAVLGIVAPRSSTTLDLREIEVRDRPGHGPHLALRGAARRRWLRCGLGPSRLSLACSGAVAMAVVVGFARAADVPPADRGAVVG